MTKEEAFEQFWAKYPRKVAKGHAKKAFDKVYPRDVSLETMLLAIAAYVRYKPDRTDFKHPATWINSWGWHDEWHGVPAVIPQNAPRPGTMADLTRDLFSGAGYDRTSH